MANAHGMYNLFVWSTWRTCHVTEAGIDIMSEPRWCVLDAVATGHSKNNPDARFSRLYFCHSLNRLQRGLSAIAELLVSIYHHTNVCDWGSILYS